MPFRQPNIARPRGHTLLRWLAAAALAVDAYIHADLAEGYDAVVKSVSQGDLFRLEAGLAALAALLILVRPHRSTLAFAFLVAAGGLAALLLYRYVDVGPIGPIPNMYEPVWYADKQAAAAAEAVAVLATGYLLLVHRRIRA